MIKGLGAKLAFNLAKESLISIFTRKLPWNSVAERFFTRLIIYSLEKLKSYSKNYVVQSTVDDVIRLLKGKDLLVADEKILGD